MIITNVIIIITIITCITRRNSTEKTTFRSRFLSLSCSCPVPVPSLSRPLSLLPQVLFSLPFPSSSSLNSSTSFSHFSPSLPLRSPFSWAPSPVPFPSLTNLSSSLVPILSSVFPFPHLPFLFKALFLSLSPSPAFFSSFLFPPLLTPQSDGRISIVCVS